MRNPAQMNAKMSRKLVLGMHHYEHEILLNKGQNHLKISGVVSHKIISLKVLKTFGQFVCFVQVSKIWFQKGFT